MAVVKLLVQGIGLALVVVTISLRATPSAGAVEQQTLALWMGCLFKTLVPKRSPGIGTAPSAQTINLQGTPRAASVGAQNQKKKEDVPGPAPAAHHVEVHKLHTHLMKLLAPRSPCLASVTLFE